MADYCSEHKMPVSFLSKENNQVFFYVSAKNTGIWSYNWLDQWTIGTRHNYRSQKKACATLTFFFFFFRCKGYPLDVSGYLETGQALQCKGYPLDGSGYLETGQALHQLHLLHLSDDEGLLDALQLSPAVYNLIKIRHRLVSLIMQLKNWPFWLNLETKRHLGHWIAVFRIRICVLRIRIQSKIWIRIWIQFRILPCLAR